MRRARDIQPLLRRRLIRAKLLPHAVGEDLCAAARDGLEACGLELFQHLAYREAGDFRKMCDFHAREALEIKLRELLVQRLQDAEVLLKAPGRVQAAHHMQTAHIRVFQCLAHEPYSLFFRHRIGTLIARIAAKGAELAVRGADVRQIDMAVHVVVDDIATFLLTHVISQRPQPSQVMAVEQTDAVLPAQPLALQHFLLDILVFFRREQNIASLIMMPREKLVLLRSTSPAQKKKTAPCRHRRRQSSLADSIMYIVPHLPVRYTGQLSIIFCKVCPKIV